jgi:hypothetical protein
LQPLNEEFAMNRSQAVSAGLWYNPTPEQRLELKLRAEAFRSKQRRRVMQTFRTLQHEDIVRAFTVPAWMLRTDRAEVQR